MTAVVNGSLVGYNRKIGGNAQPEIAAVGNASMPKALCWFGTGVAAILLLVFGLDLAVGIPFGGVSSWMDIGFIVCSVILGYLSWITKREQT